MNIWMEWEKKNLHSFGNKEINLENTNSGIECRERGAEALQQNLETV